MQMHWASIQEFLKLHYVLSARDDSDYWRSASSDSGVSQALSDKLALWRCRAPGIWILPELMNCSPLPVTNTFGWG